MINKKLVRKINKNFNYIIVESKAAVPLAFYEMIIGKFMKKFVVYNVDVDIDSTTAKCIKMKRGCKFLYQEFESPKILINESDEELHKQYMKERHFENISFEDYKNYCNSCGYRHFFVAKKDIVFPDVEYKNEKKVFEMFRANCILEIELYPDGDPMLEICFCTPETDKILDECDKILDECLAEYNANI